MSTAEKNLDLKGYTPTIGIECHVQLKTKTKLFGTASNEAREAEPNTLVDQVCFGLPGALPVLNGEAVRLAAKAAFALGTTPQKFSKFDRKHYFYPDLPKGYQISQFDQPIILNGVIDIVLEDGTTKTIHITRAHMEEDAGKSTHPAGADYSLVDLNRAGTPLLEIVSEPEIHTAQEAKAYAKELWLRMKYAGVSDVDLYHGNMRFDVNVSVSKDPAVLGTRSETKNLNSFRSVERAVEYEIKRQIALLQKGEKVVQETRGWLDDEQKTVSQRSKEDAHDYRYFPDPDIPPVELTDAFVEDIKQSLPVMPMEWRERLEKSSLEREITENLIESNIRFEADFLDMICAAEPEQAKAFGNWVVNIEVPLLRKLAESGQTVRACDATVRSQLFSAVYDLSSANKLSSNNAKAIIEEVLQSGELPDDVEAYSDKKGYLQVSDSGEIEAIVKQVLADNPKAAEDVKNGEQKAIGFLVGQVMKLSQGKANPALAKEIIEKELST